MSGQISSALILLAVAFLLPGFIFAALMAFFMRRYNRFRSWIRITLVLTVLGTAMWTYAVRYQGVDIGSLQIGSMASVVALFSAVLALVSVWIVPRKFGANLNPPPHPGPPPQGGREDNRPIKTPRIDV